MKVTLVTGNWAKIAQARAFLEPLGIEVENIKMDTVEIQADKVEDVASYSAKWASEKLKKNIVKNDTGIEIEALKGFPSAYTHYISDTIDVEGILKLMDGEKNRKAKFVQALALCQYGKEPVVFKSETSGTIALKKEGTYGWSWDFIFIPDGYDKTMGNYPDEERCYIWNTDAYAELVKFLK